LTSGAEAAQEKKEDRAREIKASLAAVDKKKKGGEKNATSAGYRSFVSKHDTNASLKERVPNPMVSRRSAGHGVTLHHRSAYVSPSTYAHITLCAGFRVLSTTSR